MGLGSGLFPVIAGVVETIVRLGCARLTMGENERFARPERVNLAMGETVRNCSWVVTSPRRSASARREITLEGILFEVFISHPQPSNINLCRHCNQKWKLPLTCFLQRTTLSLPLP